MLDAFRHDEHLAGFQADRFVAKLDVDFSLEHEKEIVRVGMRVPVEFALTLTTMTSWLLNTATVRGDQC